MHTHSTFGRTSVNFPSLLGYWRLRPREGRTYGLYCVSKSCTPLLPEYGNHLFLGPSMFHSVWALSPSDLVDRFPFWYLDRCPASNSLGWMCSSLGWCEKLTGQIGTRPSHCSEWQVFPFVSVASHTPKGCHHSFISWRGSSVPLTFGKVIRRDPPWVRVRCGLLFSRCVLSSGLVLVVRLTHEWAVFPSKPSVSVTTAPQPQTYRMFSLPFHRRMPDWYRTFGWAWMDGPPFQHAVPE